MAVPTEFIDELVARSDIVDVVSDYVHLTQKGGSYWGLCPFHGEKTASFHVVPDRQMFHCFGCGKGGGVVSFVMEMENLPYIDALRLLAKRANLDFPEQDLDETARKRRGRLLALNREAARYFHSQLWSPVGEQGLDYLRRRGLSRRTLTRFGLGYAPESWDSLIRAMTDKGFRKSDLLEAGLAVSNKKGGIYDRFRDRVMFPIIDLRGDVIGFGGRVLGDGTPKYLNSPDTPVFNKSRNLFALNLAKTSKLGRIVLTEGYMDTISLYQAGFDCAVASLGTSLTADHARLIARFTKEVVICYDSDQAGVQAAERAIPLLEKTGLKVRVLRVTGAKDPDEYIKTYGPDAFGQLLNQSENHLDYSLDQLAGRFDLNDTGQKLEFAKAAVELLAKIGDPINQELMANKVAELTGVGKRAILDEASRSYKSSVRSARKKEQRKSLIVANQFQPQSRQDRYDNSPSARAEEEIINYLIHDVSLLRETAALRPEDFSSPMLGRIFDLFRQRAAQGKSIRLGALEGVLSPEEISHLARIMDRPVDTANSRQGIRDSIQKIRQKKKLEEADIDNDTLMQALALQRQKGKAGDGTP